MKLAGVAAKQRKRFKATIDSNHRLPVAPQSFKSQIFRDHPELRMGWRHYLYLDVRGVPVFGGCD